MSPPDPVSRSRLAGTETDSLGQSMDTRPRKPPDAPARGAGLVSVSAAVKRHLDHVSSYKGKC